MASPAARWLPALPRAILVGHLLGHASGLPGHRLFYQRLWAGDLAGAADVRAALVAMAAATEPEAAPGVRATYSDVGYIVLGAILERELHDLGLDGGADDHHGHAALVREGAHLRHQRVGVHLGELLFLHVAHEEHGLARDEPELLTRAQVVHVVEGHRVRGLPLVERGLKRLAHRDHALLVGVAAARCCRSCKRRAIRNSAASPSKAQPTCYFTARPFVVPCKNFVAIGR